MKNKIKYVCSIEGETLDLSLSKEGKNHMFVLSNVREKTYVCGIKLYLLQDKNQNQI